MANDPKLKIQIETSAGLRAAEEAGRAGEKLPVRRIWEKDFTNPACRSLATR